MQYLNNLRCKISDVLVTRMQSYLLSWSSSLGNVASSRMIGVGGNSIAATDTALIATPTHSSDTDNRMSTTAVAHKDDGCVHRITHTLCTHVCTHVVYTNFNLNRRFYRHILSFI